MTYKESLTAAMTGLASDKSVLFVGYNTRCGSKGGGTFSGVSERQLIETPVAENLMAGMSIGLALDGWKPVIYIERFDFILNAIDAIVNHLDKMKMMSDGEFNPTAIIRVVVGGKERPLYTGPTHTQDFSEAFRKMVSFPVVRMSRNPDDPESFIIPELAYRQAFENLPNHSTMIVEYRDRYDDDLSAPACTKTNIAA
jgi:pyruvate dehydrogenase E1 component beta subunit